MFKRQLFYLELGIGICKESNCSKGTERGKLYCLDTGILVPQAVVYVEFITLIVQDIKNVVKKVVVPKELALTKSIVPIIPLIAKEVIVLGE